MLSGGYLPGMVRVLAAVLVAFAVTAPEAQAGWKLDRAEAIANVVWDAPCGGAVRVTFTRLEDDTPDGQGIALAPWVIGRAANCAVELNDEATFPWPVLCTVMLHEFGHLAGFRDTASPDPLHSSNPRSVMRADMGGIQYDEPSIWALSFADRRCRARGRPYLEKHGLLATSQRTRKRSGQTRGPAPDR